MRFEVHHYHHDPEVEVLLLEILGRIKHVEAGMSQTATALANLQAQVAQNETVEESAVTLIQGLAQQIAQAGTDPVALKALTDGLNKSATDLAASITANTPPPTAPTA